MELVFNKKGTIYKVLIDDADYLKIKDYSFVFDSHKEKRDYIRVRIRKNNIMYSLVREILNVKDKNLVIDHINGNTLDNRRSNLRVCKQFNNSKNQSIRKNNTSGFKGVSWYPKLKKWSSYIIYNYKKYHLGYYDTKENAALSYNKKATELFGEYARLNEVT